MHHILRNRLSHYSHQTNCVRHNQDDLDNRVSLEQGWTQHENASNGNISRVTGPLWWESVEYLHKGKWRGILMFSLTCAKTNDWTNNRDASDLRCHRAHYAVTAMTYNTYCEYRGRDKLYRELTRGQLWFCWGTLTAHDDVTAMTYNTYCEYRDRDRFYCELTCGQLWFCWGTLTVL